MTRLAPGDALPLFSQALDLYTDADDPDPGLGVDLGIGLGTAQRQTGDPAYHDTLLDAARRAVELSDTGRLVAAALANDTGFLSKAGVIDTDKVAILETALERLPTEHPDRALVLAHLCSELSFGSSLERRRALAEEAVTTAKSSGDDATVARVLVHVLLALSVPPLLEQSLTWAAEALVRARRAGDPVLLFWAADRRGLAAARSGDIDELDRCIALQGSLAAQVKQPTMMWIYGVELATRELIAGNADRGEHLATEARQIGTDGGEPDAFAFFGGQLMNVNGLRGTLGELVPLIEQGAAERPGLPGYIAALAMVHAEYGQTEKARRLLEEFASGGFDFPLDPVWLTAMACYARAAVGCRDPAYAGPLLERLAPWANLWEYEVLTADGPISYHTGCLATVVGRYDVAETYFEQAFASSSRAGAKFFAARTELGWGWMLTERGGSGDIERARELLTDARARAAENGYADVERRANEILNSLG
jgi:tetratricopeptide (TPR) repeat protein